MDSYFLSIVMVGILGFSASWLPFLSKKIFISHTIVFIALGWLAYSVLGDQLPWPNPFRQQVLTVKLTELLVIIALTGAGLKIDRKFSFKDWQAPLRLVGIYMLLSTFFISAVSYYILGLPLAVAILIGAVTAPTDPVLASTVQAGPPNSKDTDDVRFTLTAEAGLNDGLAFPLTWLAIACAQASSGESFLWSWFEFDVLWRIGCGGVMGLLIGKTVAYVYFRLPEKFAALEVRDGLVALSMTLFAYGLTELVNGYGFIAVFVSAVTIRNYEFEHEYHKELHSFIDQVERVLLSVLIFLLGGSIYGGVLDALTWEMAVVAIIFVLFFRPLAAMVSLIGMNIPKKEKWAISFFGIKGIGSFFYLAYALEKHDFALQEELWAFVAFVVLVSILVHGLTAIVTMKKLNPT